MSVMALNNILAYIKKQTSDDFRKDVLNLETASLVLKRTEVMPEIARAVALTYNLNKAQQEALAKDLDSAWNGIVFDFIRNTKSNAAREIITNKPGEIIIIQRGGAKDKYGALSDSLNKENGGFYKPFWSRLLPKMRQAVIDAGEKIKQKKSFQLVSTGELDKKGNPVKERVYGEMVDDFSPGSLLNLGHYQGSNIQYLSAYAFRENLAPENMADLKKIMVGSPYGMSTYDTKIDMLSELSSKFSSAAGPGDFKKTVTLRLEYGVENQERGRTIEKKLRPKMVAYLEDIIKTADSLDWINQEASDNAMVIVDKKLLTIAKEGGAKVTRNTRINAKPSRAKDKQNFTIKQNSKKWAVKSTGKRVQQEQGARPEAVPSFLSLITLINSRLPPQVRANMTGGRLRNRTGRLSESARVTNITPTVQGFPSIEYNYQRDPYDVFDKTKGKAPWNEPARDPSALIALSVRQIARELGMTRFYTRRAQ